MAVSHGSGSRDLPGYAEKEEGDTNNSTVAELAPRQANGFYSAPIAPYATTLNHLLPNSFLRTPCERLMLPPQRLLRELVRRLQDERQDDRVLTQGTASIPGGRRRCPVGCTLEENGMRELGRFQGWKERMSLRDFWKSSPINRDERRCRLCLDEKVGQPPDGASGMAYVGCVLLRASCY